MEKANINLETGKSYLYVQRGTHGHSDNATLYMAIIKITDIDNTYHEYHGVPETVIHNDFGWGLNNLALLGGCFVEEASVELTPQHYL